MSHKFGLLPQMVDKAYVPGGSSVCHDISAAVLILTPALGKVGATSVLPKSKLTLKRVAVQGQKVGKGLLCPNGIC